MTIIQHGITTKDTEGYGTTILTQKWLWVPSFWSSVLWSLPLVSGLPCVSVWWNLAHVAMAIHHNRWVIRNWTFDDVNYTTTVLQKLKQTKLIYFDIGQLQAQTTNQGKVRMLMVSIKFYLIQLLHVVNALLESSQHAPWGFRKSNIMKIKVMKRKQKVVMSNWKSWRNFFAAF